MSKPSKAEIAMFELSEQLAHRSRQASEAATATPISQLLADAETVLDAIISQDRSAPIAALLRIARMIGAKNIKYFSSKYSLSINQQFIDRKGAISRTSAEAYIASLFVIRVLELESDKFIGPTAALRLAAEESKLVCNRFFPNDDQVQRRWTVVGDRALLNRFNRISREYIERIGFVPPSLIPRALQVAGPSLRFSLTDLKRKRGRPPKKEK